MARIEARRQIHNFFHLSLAACFVCFAGSQGGIALTLGCAVTSNVLQSADLNETSHFQSSHVTTGVTVPGTSIAWGDGLLGGRVFESALVYVQACNSLGYNVTTCDDRFLIQVLETSPRSGIDACTGNAACTVCRKVPLQSDLIRWH